MPGAGRRSSRRTPPSPTGCAPSGWSTSCSTTGHRRAGRGGRGLRVGARRPLPGGREPQPGPRPGLLHRHGLRDLHGRLREPQVGRRWRPLRRARLRRQDDLPGRRHLVRHLADRRAAASAAACCPPTAPSRPPCWSRSTDEDSRGASDADRPAAACARRAHRGRRRRAEVRQADPVRRAARHPVRLVPRRRRSGPPGQGHPQRRPGRRRPGHLDAARRGPAPARGLDLVPPTTEQTHPTSKEQHQ